MLYYLLVVAADELVLHGLHCLLELSYALPPLDVEAIEFLEVRLLDLPALLLVTVPDFGDVAPVDLLLQGLDLTLEGLGLDVLARALALLLVDYEGLPSIGMGVHHVHDILVLRGHCLGRLLLYLLDFLGSGRPAEL